MRGEQPSTGPIFFFVTVGEAAGFFALWIPYFSLFFFGRRSMRLSWAVFLIGGEGERDAEKVGLFEFSIL